MFGLIMALLSFLCIFSVSKSLGYAYATEYLLYMDDYEACQKSIFFDIQHEEYIIHAKGSMHWKMFGYTAKRCSLRFKTNSENHVCAEIKDFHITDCSVQLKFFHEKSLIDLKSEPSESNIFERYMCGDSPGSVCSPGPNLTIQLYKGKINAQGYSFQIKVLSKHNHIWVIVGVISGVTVFVVILATITLYYCCYKKNRCKCFRFQSPPTERELTTEEMQMID